MSYARLGGSFFEWAQVISIIGSEERFEWLNQDTDFWL